MSGGLAAEAPGNARITDEAPENPALPGPVAGPGPPGGPRWGGAHCRPVVWLVPWNLFFKQCLERRKDTCARGAYICASEHRGHTQAAGYRWGGKTKLHRPQEAAGLGCRGAVTSCPHLPAEDARVKGGVGDRSGHTATGPSAPPQGSR